MSAFRWIGLEELAERRDEWRGLLAKAAIPNAFADPGWVFAWLRAYGRRHQPWCFAMVSPAGALEALAVLSLSRSPLGRTLAFVGNVWNGMESLVCAPAAEARFVPELLAALDARGAEWDGWRIWRLPASTELAGALSAGRGPLRTRAVDRRLQPFVTLPASVEEFEARFSGKMRNTQRRKAKQLERLGARMRLVTDPGELPAALARLLELRMARAREQHQAHAHMDARFEQFLLYATRGMLPEAARLWTLELGGETLAMRLNLIAGALEHSYLLGFGAQHSKLSPGSVLERASILNAIEEGRTEIDFGPGREEYKYRWGARDRTLLRLAVSNRKAGAWLKSAAVTLDVRMRGTAAAEALRRRRGVAPSY